MSQHELRGDLLQLIASLSVCLVIIPGGMHYGWTAPAFPLLRKSSINLNEKDEVWLESLFFAAQIVSLPLIVFMIDRVGRRTTILISAVIGVISWLFLAFANHVLHLYGVRFLAGVSYSMSFTAAPIYISEIAGQKYRGLLTVFIFMATVIGIILVYSLVPFTQSFPFMPESPYYLVSVGKLKLTESSLDRLRSITNHNNEIVEITKTVSKSSSENSAFKELFCHKNNRKSLMLLSVLAFAQQFTGFSVILMNFKSILHETQSSKYFPSDLVEIAYSIFMLIGSVICAATVDKTGRRVLLSVSCFASGLFLLGTALYYNLLANAVDVSSLDWFAPTCLIFFAICYHIGLGPLLETLEAELFTTRARAIGSTISGALNCAFGFVSLPLYDFIRREFSLCVPFYLFSAVGFVSAGICFKFLPETKGKTFQEIQEILREQDANG